LADDADDVEAVVREHFTTINAGNQDAHFQQHHTAQYQRYSVGGLGRYFESIEEQQEQIQTTFDLGSKYNLGIRDLRETICGDSALATCYLVGSILRPDGNTVQRRARWSSMLIKQSGQWKAVHAHSSPLRIAVAQ